MSEDEPNVVRRRSLSRRDLLKRGAVGGGVVAGGVLVWNTPIVQSLTGQENGSPVEERCTTFYGAKYELQPDGETVTCESITAMSDLNPGSCLDSLPTNLSDGGCDHVVSVVREPDDDDKGDWIVTLEPGCRLIAACSKCGGGSENNDAPEIAPSTYRFSACETEDGGTRGISHIEFLFCC